MASAAITVGNKFATIESDTNAATITKDPPNTRGYLTNGGSVKVFIADPTGTLATTDAQVNGVVGLPPGATLPMLTHYGSITHKTASSSSVLYWFPVQD